MEGMDMNGINGNEWNEWVRRSGEGEDSEKEIGMNGDWEVVK